ncbi:MAG TPA: HEPN domain-containing protein [Gemmataceae bacterium]|nr:HEPN domain-containing protein [Gemmataceae bacterium]
MATSGPYDTACFHAQQAIEKTFKAFLAYHQKPIPRTHDLEELARLSQGLEPSLTLPMLELANASDYAVQLRYDMDVWPTRDEAQEALLLAERMLAAVLVQLPPTAHPKPSP